MSYQAFLNRKSQTGGQRYDQQHDDMFGDVS